MKINDQISSQSLEKSLKSTGAKKSSLGDLDKLGSPITEASDSSSSVKLSDKARRMNQAKEMASDSSVDMDKVKRLQSLIDSGEYKVNADAIADKLVDEHLLLSE